MIVAMLHARTGLRITTSRLSVVHRHVHQAAGTATAKTAQQPRCRSRALHISATHRHAAAGPQLDGFDAMQVRMLRNNQMSPRACSTDIFILHCRWRCSTRCALLLTWTTRRSARTQRKTSICATCAARLTQSPSPLAARSVFRQA
eukprot:SAG11_NODE_14002_length_629_cov_0.918868_1_plen_145_part_10